MERQSHCRQTDGERKTQRGESDRGEKQRQIRGGEIEKKSERRGLHGNCLRSSS